MKYEEREFVFLRTKIVDRETSRLRGNDEAERQFCLVMGQINKELLDSQDTAKPIYSDISWHVRLEHFLV